MWLLSNIQAARKAAKHTQKDAAKAINCSRERIIGIESNDGKATLAEIERLAASFGCTVLILDSTEKQILEQIMRFLADFGQKIGKNAE